jgi:type VI secretion system protein ImpK
LLELLYYCISLGFEGKYRVAARGASELTVLREDLYRLIRVARGEFERDISPHWRGAANDGRWAGDIIPTWVAAAVTALLLIGLYIGLAYLLNGRSDGLFDQLATLPPNGAVSLARVATPPPPPVVIQQSERLRRFLEPEIREGLVTVKEDAQTITVLIRGAGMFESGSASVITSFTPLLDRIGEALNDQPGAVLVTGHTDTTPIHSLAFPSNWHLSVARATNVGQIIQSKMTDPAPVPAALVHVHRRAGLRQDDGAGQLRPALPARRQDRQGAVRGIGGTRNCDWWFTDEAVLIDTAGRYTTQSSNREVDAAAWTGFLTLLKKFRPAQPLNGAIVT